MPWSWHRDPEERIELSETDAAGEDDLRLFPIVGADLCYCVATLLARGKLEEVARLVSDRAWVASTPLYG